MHSLLPHSLWVFAPQTTSQGNLSSLAYLKLQLLLVEWVIQPIFGLEWSLWWNICKRNKNWKQDQLRSIFKETKVKSKWKWETDLRNKSCKQRIWWCEDKADESRKNLSFPAWVTDWMAILTPSRLRILKKKNSDMVVLIKSLKGWVSVTVPYNTARPPKFICWSCNPQWDYIWR